MSYAFDAAFPPDLAAVKAQGGVAMNCYVSGDYAVDAAWVNKVRGAGLGAWPNYERALWELVSDRPTGQAAGRIAVSDAIRCGFPANGSIWFPFSIDVNLDPTRYNEVGAAFDGINDVNAGRYIIACYGQGGLIDYLVNTRRTKGKGWLSGSSSFPGYNPASGNVCLVQEVGSPIPGTDRDRITDMAALRAWWAPGAVPAGASSTPLEDDVTPAELQAAILAIMPHALDLYFSDVGGDRVKQADDRSLAGISAALTTVVTRTAQLQAASAAQDTQIAALAAKVADIQPGTPAAPTGPLTINLTGTAS